MQARDGDLITCHRRNVSVLAENTSHDSDNLENKFSHLSDHVSSFN